MLFAVVLVGFVLALALAVFLGWVNLSLVALWFALDSTTLRGRLWAWAVVGLACALGFLTKGFLAWVLPVLIE